MNNFKKLLASAMALTMVTSVLPVTGVNAADEEVSCSYSQVEQANEVVSKIVYDLDQAGYTVYNVPADESIEWNSLSSINGKETVEKVLDKGNVKDYLKCTTSDEGKHLAKLNAQIANFRGNDGLNARLRREFASGGALYNEVISKEEWRTLESLYNEVIAFEAYIENIPSEVDEANVDEYIDNADSFKDMVADYKDTYLDSYIRKYADALLTQKVAGETTVEDILDGDKFERTNLSKLEDFIKKVEEDKWTFKKADETEITDLIDYETVADEDEIAEIMEGLDAVVEEIKEVNDLLKSTSDANKALKAVKTEVNELVSAIKANDEDRVYRATNAFRAEDIENLTTYVDELFSKFYTVDIRERSNGRYAVELEPAEMARYLTEKDAADFSENSGVGYLMVTLVDAKSDETYYDVLTEGRTEVEDLLAAVEAIEEVNVGDSFTNTEAETILAAKRALNELDVVGSDATDPYHLTSKEKRMVRSNADLIESLYFKLILSGTVVNDGWIDLGNGNWDYYVNGQAFNGWVCTAKDTWYYVSNGHMLRNSWVWRDATSAYYVGNDGKMLYGPTTTPDGYALDANGLWHA